MKLQDYGLWIIHESNCYSSDQFIDFLNQHPGENVYFQFVVHGIYQYFEEGVNLKELENNEAVGELVSSMRGWIKGCNSYSSPQLFSFFHACAD